jgi:two-component system LytT family response regulator
MRALIVDDEPLARRGVALRLKKFAGVEVVGECADGQSAVTRILELAPDVVFLDVQMPGMDGFDVLRALPRESLPGVIFLTAYEQHALRAFDVQALDYLLKPVDDERFAAALERARRFTESATKAQTTEQILRLLGAQPEPYASRLPVRTGSRIQVVPVEEIEWIGAAGDYAELHTNGRCHLLRETMGSLEQKLDPRQFLRIHRSRIVRAGSIRELRSIENREYIVRLSDGSTLRSSRSYADRLEAWLSTGGPAHR